VRQRDEVDAALLLEAEEGCQLEAAPQPREVRLVPADQQPVRVAEEGSDVADPLLLGVHVHLVDGALVEEAPLRRRAAEEQGERQQQEEVREEQVHSNGVIGRRGEDEVGKEARQLLRQARRLRREAERERGQADAGEPRAVEVDRKGEELLGAAGGPAVRDKDVNPWHDHGQAVGHRRSARVTE